MADAGVTNIQISAVSGHSPDQVKKILETCIVPTYKQDREMVAKLELGRPNRIKKKQESGNDV